MQAHNLNWKGRSVEITNVQASKKLQDFIKNHVQVKVFDYPFMNSKTSKRVFILIRGDETNRWLWWKWTESV